MQTMRDDSAMTADLNEGVNECDAVAQQSPQWSGVALAGI